MGRPYPPRPRIDQLRSTDSVYKHHFTPEFVAELLRETNWFYPDGPWAKPLTPDERIPVEAGGSCPRCGTSHGENGYDDVLIKGEVTGITRARRVTCPCDITKMVNIYWLDLKIVDKRYRAVRHHNLKPIDDEDLVFLSARRQAEIIDQVKANLTGSYFFVGPGGTGKTHYSMAMYHHALERWAVGRYLEDHDGECSVFRVNTGRLLDKYVAFERTQLDYPYINPDKIRSLAERGHRVCMYFDEIDKFPATEFKLNKLFDLLEALEGVEAQVVAISNASLEQLTEKWGNDKAVAIIRRISSKASNGALILFDEEG
jgi:hypothetical protein